MKRRSIRGWQRIRLLVKRRDNYLCRSCGVPTSRGECDHIVPVHLGGHETALSNIQLLCRECHFSKSRAEQTVTPQRLGHRAKAKQMVAELSGTD